MFNPGLLDVESMWVLTEERNANKVQVIRDSCHAEKTDEIRGIRQHFQTVWLWWWWVRWWCVRKHWARQKTCFVLFFSPKHFSVGVGGRKGSEHHTHPHTGWMISSYHPVTSSSLSWQTQQIPPFAALYPVYSVSIECISYNENTFFLDLLRLLD